MTFKPGDVVGSKRWPYSAAHPDCWRAPLQGIVLEQDDPRAWAGTLAFPERVPDRAKITAHVARCRAEGLLNETPVLWECLGREVSIYKVWWEKPNNLRTYADDYAEWQAARAKERERYAA